MAESPDLTEVAARLIWWQAPEVSLAQPERFLAQVEAVKSQWGWDAFRKALGKSPAGVLDQRSWTSWHGFFGLAEPPLPQGSLS
ncbi:MAG TPA: hypothetical protein VHH73_09070 [Verrucomicrobiae bacterium]|nr:hypothetical protein [Verrucomicrobiae bacterium]